MNLDFEERRCLALYLEFFNRCYNVDDERKYDVSPTHSIFVRHIEAQNIVYFLQVLGIYFDYGFIWDWRGPSSPGLQAILNRLDKKEEAITEFYDSYNIDRSCVRYNNYKQQLQDSLTNYTHSENISKISTASFVLEDILKEERGSEYLADLIYIGKTVLPGSDLPRILKELNRRKVNLSPETSEAIWKSLGILGIRNIEPKEFTRKRTLENESCRGIR